jgi:hypothetical protein
LGGYGGEGWRGFLLAARRMLVACSLLAGVVAFGAAAEFFEGAVHEGEGELGGVFLREGTMREWEAGSGELEAGERQESGA